MKTNNRVAIARTPKVVAVNNTARVERVIFAGHGAVSEEWAKRETTQRERVKRQNPAMQYITRLRAREESLKQKLAAVRREMDEIRNALDGSAY